MWAQLSKNVAAIRRAYRFLLGLFAKTALEQARVLEHAEERMMKAFVFFCFLCENS
jgi:hypothetical protein